MAGLRCAVLDDFQGVALSYPDWGRIAERVEVVAFEDPMRGEDLVRALADFDIIVAMRERTPFPAELLARLPRLKLLVSTGYRNRAIDVAAATAQGVIVCGTGGRSEPTAELTWALIGSLTRHLTLETRNMREDGPWQSSLGVDLAGKRLGLLGLGKLGQRVARVGLAFDMEVVAWSQNLTPEAAAEHGVSRVEKDALFASSDIISLHLVLSGRTQGIVGEADIARMKPTSFLINTSRAGLIDMPALTAALEAGRIAGAGLDVHEIEPLPPGHPIRRLGNVVATPHLGYVTQEGYRIYYAEAVDDIQAWLEGAPLRVMS
jgi:phosphoglycerate dehydrogenase-like enzyme